MVEGMPIGVMMTDKENFEITYMNKFSTDTLKTLESYLPVKVDAMMGQCIDVFHKVPSHQRAILADPKNLPQGEWLWQGKIVGMDAWKKAGADYAQSIEGLRALDDHTIQIKLNKPFPQLTYTFAMGYSSFVPREAVELYGKEFSINPVGSGPYVLKSFTTKKAILVRNPNYRQEYFDLEYEGFDREI